MTSPEPEPNPFGAITDVHGVRVGSDQRIGDGWLTGTTVVMPPPGSVAAVEVAGGAPATRETDALEPGRLVPGANAIVLTGGSAYGLDAAGGVMRYLAGRGVGFPAFGAAASQVVPVVPAAALFDLARGGDFSATPDAGFGYRAAEAAYAGLAGGPVATGTVGAGTGALTEHGTLKGGLGTASITIGRFTVGAIVAVNAAGEIAGPDGDLYARAFTADLAARGLLTRGLSSPSPQEAAAWREHRARAALSESGATAEPGAADGPASNTTIATVATNAALDTASTKRLAGAAHAGIARAVRPSHTLVDGDTIFAVATGAEALADGGSTADAPADRARALVTLGAMAADAVMLAIADAVLTASVPLLHNATGSGRRGLVGADGHPLASYSDLCPSVAGRLAE